LPWASKPKRVISICLQSRCHYGTITHACRYLSGAADDEEGEEDQEEAVALGLEVEARGLGEQDRTDQLAACRAEAWGAPDSGGGGGCLGGGGGGGGGGGWSSFTA
jgi:hypothetical protein